MTVQWPLAIPSEHREQWNARPDEDRANAAAMAVAILRGLTARTIGLDEVTVRPFPDAGRPSTYRQSVDHTWATIRATGMVASVRDLVGEVVTGSTTITLDGPVHAVEAVTVGDSPLSPDAYRVDDSTRLVRVDGSVWPAQDLTAQPGDPGYLAVTYVRGVPADAAARTAAGVLALEVIRGMSNAGACTLPANVTTVARQGMTIEVDPVAYLEAGLTGVPYVDQWVRQVNPSGIRQQPRVFIPERRRPIR